MLDSKNSYNCSKVESLFNSSNQVFESGRHEESIRTNLNENSSICRYSFRQTFAEMNAPEGIWKVGLGGAFIIIGMSLWCYVFLKKFVYPPMPKSTSEEAKLAQVKRMIGLRMNPIDGIASEYDYEKNCWK